MAHMSVCFGQAAAPPPELARTRRFNSVEEYPQVARSGPSMAEIPNVQSTTRQEWERIRNVAVVEPFLGAANPQHTSAKPRPAPLIVNTSLVSMLSTETALAFL